MSLPPDLMNPAETERSLPDLSHQTYGTMRRIVDKLSVNVCSAILPDGYYGFYDETRQLILIDRRMTYRRKKCTLVHELVHWSHADTTCTGPYGSKCERRARYETALRLINPAEYATVEQIYEGEQFHMADELDVTPEIIDDYRHILHDTTTGTGSLWLG